MSDDYYKILGIDRGASPKEIEKAYRKLARQYHPDMNPDDKTAKEKFQKVQHAYDVLNDPEKRKMYDTYGSGFEDSSGGGRTWRTYNRGTGGAEEVDFSQFFGGGQAESGGFGGFEEILRQFAGGSGRRRARQPAARGRDLHHELQVPFVTSITGGQAQVSIRREDGTIETISVKIPAGIEDGKKIRLRGQGERSPMGGTSGDLLITVRVAKHPCFRRIGSDLIVTVPVRLSEAAGGAKVDLPTPDGVITLKIPPGTSSGKRLRLKGLGDVGQHGKGDLFAEVQIVLPPVLDDADLQRLRELDDRYQRDPRGDLTW
ncbi:MAG: J domain-containing protein [Planctomycetaceae bacterium]|nr:MAG: J domain-containing protein [Planctomycetaceae bacterium]